MTYEMTSSSPPPAIPMGTGVRPETGIPKELTIFSEFWEDPQNPTEAELADARERLAADKVAEELAEEECRKAARPRSGSTDSTSSLSYRSKKEREV